MLETFLEHYSLSNVAGAIFFVTQAGILSLLLVEVIKRLDGDFPHWKNFRLVHKERPFLKQELTGELALGLFNVILAAPITAYITAVVITYALQPHLPNQPFAATIEQWPFAVQVLVGLVALDFSLYIRHRFVHHFFWSFHTIHHSTREITWITWLKLHPLDAMVMGIINVSVLYILGFGGEAIAVSGLIMFHFNRFCHSNIALDYGFPLRYIFVSPNMHRWHHAADDPKAFNTNFCIVFAWIDLLFGTFYVPKDRLPEHYGVWNEDGEHVVGTGFWEMLTYPFAEMWRTIRSRRTPPPAGEVHGLASAPSPLLDSTHETDRIASH